MDEQSRHIRMSKRLITAVKLKITRNVYSHRGQKWIMNHAADELLGEIALDVRHLFERNPGSYLQTSR